MNYTARRPRQIAIPSFQLYGEPQQNGLPDVVHIESLKDRSAQYDWEIKPHRHSNLCQILRFDTPGVVASLDGQRVEIERPALLLVPPHVVHGFTFRPDVIGTVTTIPSDVVGAVGGVRLISEGAAHFGRITAMLGELEVEYRQQAAGRARAIAGLIEVIFTLLGREGATALAPTSPTVLLDKRITLFLELVEAQFTNAWGASRYAAEIGVSKAQLSRDCQVRLGRSPMQVVHARLIKEAQRKLAYTPWSISQIAEVLGFVDLGYFSRFFRQRTGESPSEYRLRIAER